MPRKDAFRRAMEAYLENVRRTRRESTYKSYLEVSRRLIRAVRDAGVTTYVRRWRLEDVLDVLAQRAYVLPSTRLKEITVLRRMLLYSGVTVLDDAIRNGDLILPRKSRVNVRWHSEETVAYLRAMCRKDVEYVIIVLASELGLRRGEISRLRLTDIGGDVLIIRGKGEKIEPVPLTQSVYTVLERWIYIRQDLVRKALRRNPAQNVPEELLIWERGGTLHPYQSSSIGQIVWHLGKRTGIKLCPHDLRRTCGREVYKATRDLVAVNRLLRHEDLNTTRLYIGADLEDAREALAARERLRGSIAPKDPEPVQMRL